MKKGFPLILCGIGFLLLCSNPRVGAQAKAPSPSTDGGFDQIPDALARSNDVFQKRADTFFKTLDMEAGGKRVTEQVAQSLRFALRNLKAQPGVDVRYLLTNTLVPTDNDALMTALRSLEEASGIAQAQRAELHQKAGPEISKRLIDLTVHAKKSAELEPLLKVVESLQETNSRQIVGGYAIAAKDPLTQTANYLRALRQMIEAESSDNIPFVQTAIRHFNTLATATPEIVPLGYSRQRIIDTLQPLKSVAEAAQTALNEALLGRKPSKAIFTAQAVFEEAASQYNSAANAVGMDRTTDFNNVLPSYKALASGAQSVENRDWSDRHQYVQNARQAATDLARKKIVGFEPLVATWEKEVSEAMEADMRKRREELHRRLAAVKKPADLEAVVADLAKSERESRQDRLGNSGSTVASQLAALAIAWSAGEPSLIGRLNPFDQQGRASEVASEVGEFRTRIEREILAGAIQAPELLQPPLSDQPLESAVRHLADSLAERGEWRRVLTVLETRFPSNQLQAFGVSGTVQISSVRAYLAAQNFELAEQWTDAASGYKTVLRNAADRTPVQESALRLKALSKEHPEEVKAAQPYGQNTSR